METKLTKEEMAALAPYELEMLSAKEGYLRSAGREGLAIMHKVYERVTGEPYTQTDACGHCQLTLQKLIADWYFKTKDGVVDKKTVVTKVEIKGNAVVKKESRYARKGGMTESEKAELCALAKASEAPKKAPAKKGGKK